MGQGREGSAWCGDCCQGGRCRDAASFSHLSSPPRRYMRIFLAVLVLIVGATIVGGDPASFADFGYFHLPGHVAVGGALFAWGIALWFRTILGD
jgi:hypothetical protein